MLILIILKTGVSVSASENVYFRSIKLLGTGGMLHKGKRINPARNLSNSKCVCSQNQTLKYMKQKLTELKGMIDKSKIIVGNFNTLLSGTDNSVFSSECKVISMAYVIQMESLLK